VTVKGPRGTLSKSFKHLPIELTLSADGKTLSGAMWFGTRIQTASIRTCMTHVRNMITGVTRGYEYKMRLVYAHFPVSLVIDGNTVNVKNFLGEKIDRKVELLDGVSVVRSKDVKDEIVLSGNSVEMVAQSAAQIQQKARVRNKDIRKFLDGVYVSAKGNVVKEQ